MTSDQIREAFLRFFEEKGHKLIASSSLVPHGDPTLLLTGAGMVQFKPYFMGEATPPSVRLASCQKCFRATDIESVGNIKHLTFFEMLGNFSIGDYFKEDAIGYAWEFVTQRLGLPPERLWATIFLDDEESFKYWCEVGLPAERIIRRGEEDNFWGPAGDSGPCGPCSEIHYDFGEEFGCGKPDCAPGCDCQRFLEIWNLVFMQYYQDAQGQRSLLPKANIDTGLGLERTAAVMQGQRSFYDTDLFAPIIKRVSELAGCGYGGNEKADRAIRIIAEHSRAITFLISDGVLPSNEGRGYVLRRVLRRAALFGRTLGIDSPFLSEVARSAISKMGSVYPDLVENQDFILRVIDSEEEKFSQTLNTGLNLLDGIMEEAESRGDRVISGQEVFRLYDTYGFPKELTAEVAAENGLSIDFEGFEREMERQRERARAAQKLGVGEKPMKLDYTSLPQTDFVGYHKDSCEASVISLAVDGHPQGSASQGQRVEVVLDRTPFYAEMGGQVADTGVITGKDGTIAITDTRWASNIIVHYGQVAQGRVSVNDIVLAEVDTARRLDIARNHTATHLLQAALREVLGSHVHQMGSLVAPDRLRFDFSHFAAVTKEELAAVQHVVNERIRQNLKVKIRENVPIDQAKAEGALALFGEKYGEVVRVLEIGEPLFSAEVCGGTHVERTGQIGFCYIVAESSIGAGVRRIEAVTGRGAEALIEGRLSTVEAIAKQLGTSALEVEGKVRAVLAELESERKGAAQLERELSRITAESLLSKVESVNGVAVLAARVSASNMETLRQMGDWLKERLGSGVVVLGAVWANKPNFLSMVTSDLVAKGLHAGRIVKQVAQVTGGSGGGRPGLGQAGGRDKEKLDEALRLVVSLVQSG